MTTYELHRKLPLDEIDLMSLDYCFEFSGGNSTRVAVEENGHSMLYPPVLYREGGRFKPLLGRGKLLGFQKRSNTLPVGLELLGTAPGIETVRYSIQLGIEMSTFGVVERALALKRLHQLSKHIEPAWLEELGISRNDRLRRNLLLLADAPPEIKEDVYSGALHENTVFEILSLRRELWLPVSRFITSVSLGTKKRNEVVRMLRDIAGREGCDVRTLIEDREIRQYLSSTEIDPPQRAERIYNHLRALRFPSVRDFQNRFNGKLREVGLHSGLHLMIPENFERWEFRLAFDFSSAEDFRNRVEELQRIGEKPSFEDLMSMRY
jgi:hypothetical protein